MNKLSRLKISSVHVFTAKTVYIRARAIELLKCLVKSEIPSSSASLRQSGFVLRPKLGRCVKGLRTFDSLMCGDLVWQQKSRNTE